MVIVLFITLACCLLTMCLLPACVDVDNAPTKGEACTAVH
jgi:hypothetical protein